jgi:hypothetical protein
MRKKSTDPSAERPVVLTGPALLLNENKPPDFFSEDSEIGAQEANKAA